MRYYLEEHWHNGVSLYMEGQLSTPEEVMNKHCVNEEMLYMADYIINEVGKLIELRYDRITNL